MFFIPIGYTKDEKREKGEREMGHAGPGAMNARPLWERLSGKAREATRKTAAAWRATRAFSLAYPLTATAAALILASALFTALPILDIATSSLFYAPGEGFWLRTDPFLRRLRELGPFLVRIIAGASVAILLLRLFLPALKRLVDPRVPIFLLSTLIIGPGLIVNAILKDHWGRPRPVQIDAFGGDAPYVPVWRMSKHCASNCSFVSGEASTALWLLAFVFLAPPLLKRPLAAILLALAAALSFNRIAFGGHFLSDTVLSWLITLMVLLIAHRLLFVYAPQALGRERIDGWLDRIGARIRAAIGRAVRALRNTLAKFA